MAGTAVSDVPVNAHAVDFADVQGLARFGHGRLQESAFLLLRVADARAAKAWLAGAPVTPAVRTPEPPDRALQVALSEDVPERLFVLALKFRQPRAVLPYIRVPGCLGESVVECRTVSLCLNGNFKYVFWFQYQSHY